MTNITPLMGTRGGGGRAEPPDRHGVQRVHATLANLMQSDLASVLTLVRAGPVSLGVDTGGLAS